MSLHFHLLAPGPPPIVPAVTPEDFNRGYGISGEGIPNGRELRYHSTGAPAGWFPDPRRALTPAGYAVRVSPRFPGIGVAYLRPWGMLIGTFEAIDRALAEFGEHPGWARGSLGCGYSRLRGLDRSI